MKRIFPLIVLLILLIGTIITSCKKDSMHPAPTIAFMTDAGYSYKDTSLFEGDTIIIALDCKWNGSDAIKTITFSANNQIQKTENISSAQSEDFTYNIKITKTEIATENWEFEITDAKGQKNSVKIVLNLNSAINKIWATIGAQQNTTNLSYYSLSTKMNYNTSNAKTNQTIIDFLGAYDVTNALHLVSPAAPGLPVPYDTDLATWATKNNTKFCTPTAAVSVQQFNNLISDDLLISSFSTVVANQKNKAKSLKVNDIYSFLTSNNKYGLFKVTSVETGNTGKVSIEIKIQK